MSTESLDRAVASYTPPSAPVPVTPFDPVSRDPLPCGVTMLEASAGTGKTYSIASLVLRLVVEGQGMPLDRILVVTFTEAATAELRDRIRRRLRDVLGLAERARAAGAVPGDDPVARHDAVARSLLTRELAERGLDHAIRQLRDALRGFDDAAITTIHGFCLRVLREHAFACGGELDAELLADERALLDAVVRDFWVTETSRRPVALVEALVTRGALGLATLRTLAQRAVRHPDAACVPVPDAEEEASLEAALAERARLATDLAGRWVEDDASAALQLIDDARAAKQLSGVKWPGDSITKRASAVALWADGTPASGALPVKELTCFGTEALRKAVNKNGKAPEHPLFDLVDALLAADGLVKTCAIVEALRVQHACVAWVRAEMARRKRAARQHGFDDLLRIVLATMRSERGPTLVAALRDGYDAALIDEFQDTDDVQWDIFHGAFGTSERHHLVLIGDPKQSIYAFRGADVDAYLRARVAAPTRWALDTNWRTDRALVDALQVLWGAHPAPFARREIAWRPIVAHHADARLAGGGAPLQLRFLAREGPFAPSEGRNSSPLITKGKLDRHLPRLVASDVARFLGSGATITERVAGADRARAVRPADVAVLVRTHRQARAVQAALREAGVPAVIQGAESVFASREAHELAAVLAAVLEPASTSLARAAIATDLLGLAAAEELAPGEALGPGDLLARLDEDAGERWDTWAERLRRWRATWRGESRGDPATARAGAPSVMRLVRALLEELALPARLLALHDGERRLTNMLHLAELLHVTAAERALAPGATLAWLREQVANCEAARDDASRQLRLESDAEAARVVTVHSSKGLEYGAVWCPYLWDGKGVRDADLDYPCVASPDAPGARTIDLLGGKQSPSAARLEDERFAESMRLAYVALTRARHRVTLWWGAATDFETSPLAWLLHGGDAEDAASARASIAAQVAGLKDAALRARLDALAADARGLIAVEDEDPDAPAASWRAPDVARPALAARAWTRTAPLDDGWRLGSFTGLTRGAHAHRDADDDAEAPEALEDARRAGDGGETGGDVPLAAFPASAQAGLFFHEVLERHDPERPDDLRPLVAQRLGAYGFDAARWCDPVTAQLQAMLDAPLEAPLHANGGAPLRLRDVPLAARMTELRFELPACGADGAPAVSAQALARAFREHPGGSLDAATLERYADRVASLGFRPLRGFLTGAIDLVARHDGRWWLLDYKSNRLGARRAEYAAAQLTREMTDAHYVLQYHLYALALHRWLAWRVPGYDWDRDVGGACYVFLRGVGEGTGVFVDRPPRARIEALDRLFRDGA